MVAGRDAVTYVSVIREAADSSVALWSVIADIERAVAGCRVARVDDDLVATTDIAARTGRSRESVRLLAEGRRGDGDFPAPVGYLSGGVRVWTWASVNRWFQARGEGDDARSLDAVVAIEANARLAAATALREAG
jgi:hypothetical protein